MSNRESQPRPAPITSGHVCGAVLRLEGMHLLCFCGLACAGSCWLVRLLRRLLIFGLEFAQPTLLEHSMVGRGLVWALSLSISTSSTYADEQGALQDSSLHWMVGRILFSAA